LEEFKRMLYDKLKSKKSFSNLRNSGSSYVAPAFVILVIQNKNSSETLKLGFTTSKKVGNAVKRVKARRRLKAAVDRLPQETIDFFKGFEFNIIGRPRAIDVDFEKLVFYFEKTLKNIKKDYE